MPRARFSAAFAHRGAVSPQLLWKFPLPRPYTGIMLGNGVQGILVWGEGRLHLSVGRTGFWDRRRGVPFVAHATFGTVRRLLEQGREAELRRAFVHPRGDLPYRTPGQIPGGRVELDFGPGVRPVSAVLDPSRGVLRVELSDGGAAIIRQAPTDELVWIVPERTRVVSVTLSPAWRWLGETLARGGVAPPEEWTGPSDGGFVQRLPEDSALALAWTRRGNAVAIASAVGPTPREGAVRLARTAELRRAGRKALRWCQTYWRSVPRVSLPDPVLQREWDYGLHRQAGLTPPQGLPATLQGAWMAEHELPPWSNDYHFNINVQMIYGPALATNRPDHLWPLWRMLLGWLPQLRANGETFFGAPGVLMLPHAVDDRGQVIGHYWQGTIDQACVAWMAQLAWLHYRHTLDRSLLRSVAWPLLVGAFEGFWAMLEPCRQGGGRQLALPVSVSPEFGSWGRNSSFQLAALHCVAAILPLAARALRKPIDSRWDRVRRELPPYATMTVARVWGQPGLKPRITLWAGQDLTESHRHHSHLAAVFPFRTVDPSDEEHRETVKRTLEHWAATGAGQWVGWSMPWAACLWARCNEASAAVTLLRIQQDVFTNLGGASLHNADAPGYSSWIHGPFLDDPAKTRTADQMQMDAAMGTLQAIAEILVQQRGSTLHILPSVPKQWRDLSFDGIRTEGAFIVGATLQASQVREVRIRSLAGGRLRLAHGLGPHWRQGRRRGTGAVIELRLRRGQSLVLRRAAMHAALPAEAPDAGAPCSAPR